MRPLHDDDRACARRKMRHMEWALLALVVSATLVAALIGAAS